MAAGKRVSSHDRKVQDIAKDLASKGWKVTAALPGYEAPNALGDKNRVVPDIIAMKKGATRVVEVETQSSVRVQQSIEQAETLRRSVAQRKRTSLQIIVSEDD